MRYHEDNRQEKLKETLFAAKIITMIITAMIFMGQREFWRAEEDPEITMIALLGLFVVMFFMYELWMVFQSDRRKSRGGRFKNAMEIAIFLVFFNSIIMFSGGHASPHKFLYLFVIITATLQFGQVAGFLTAGVSAVSLLAVDLTALPEAEINLFFQNDLILCSLFFLVAWILGRYMAAEQNVRGQLVEIANLDKMTDVYNHRYFQESLVLLFDQAQRQGEPLALLFIDVDDFKKINDLFGHFIGDRVLKDVARLIVESVRESDVVCRYGGEEFTVLLPGQDEATASAIAERIRLAIERETLREEVYRVSMTVTVSIGVSVYPHKALSREELVQSADNALYAAKQKQKNRVEVC